MEPIAHVTQFIEKVQSDQIVNEKLTSNELSVISILGGIENVLTLCLTHHDADEEYCRHVISSAMQMIDESTNAVDDLMRAQLPNINPTQITDTRIDPNDSIPIPKQKNTVLVRNTLEYEKSGIIVIPDTRRNLYYRWFNRDTSNWIMNVIFNKWYCIGCVSICSVILLFARIAKVVYGAHNLFYLIALIIGQSLAIVFSISFIMGMNLDIIYFLRNSFDFWFKMWNLIIWQMSFIWLNIHRDEHNHVAVIMTALAALATPITIFLIDAIPMKYYVKKICLAIFVLYFSLRIVIAYFTYSDEYFNPFEAYSFEHTRVSVKDLYLGAFSNILLFVAKPLLGDTLRWVLTQYLKCTFKGTKQIDDITDKTKKHKAKNVHSAERFVSLYKRSKVKW